MTEGAVISGMGAVCSCGGDPDEIFRSVRDGMRRFAPASRLHPDALPFPFLAADDAFFPGGRRASAADTLNLAIHAARQALTTAFGGTEQDVHPPERMAVVVGTTSGAALHFLAGYAAVRAGRPGPHPDMEDWRRGSPARLLAGMFGLSGPASTVNNACTSGADAIGVGLALLRQGLCDCVLCGGADALGVVPHSGFSRLMIHDPHPCRPFDVGRNGLNLGEGAAFFVLERAAAARRRGAPSFGGIAGYGSAADGHHPTAPRPDGGGLEAAIGSALRDARISARDLSFVNAHGTGTRENDRAEGRLLARILDGTPVWASKGCTGHALGAAGALEAMLGVQALAAGILPRSHGFQTTDPEIGLAPTRETAAFSGRYALSTSLGFGGGNAALILERSA